MCENVVGPICPPLEQFADDTANLPTHRFRLPLVRLPGFLGVGFLFTSFSKAFKGEDFTGRENFPRRLLKSMKGILPPRAFRSVKPLVTHPFPIYEMGSSQ